MEKGQTQYRQDHWSSGRVEDLKAVMKERTLIPSAIVFEDDVAALHNAAKRMQQEAAGHRYFDARSKNGEGVVTAVCEKLECSSTRTARMFRRMSRAQERFFCVTGAASEANKAGEEAVERDEKALVAGVSTGVLGPTRNAVFDTREVLANAIAVQNTSYEKHDVARGRTQHALEVGMVAAAEITRFKESNDGILEEDNRDRATTA